MVPLSRERNNKGSTTDKRSATCTTDNRSGTSTIFHDIKDGPMLIVSGGGGGFSHPTCAPLQVSPSLVLGYPHINVRNGEKIIEYAEGKNYPSAEDCVSIFNSNISTFNKTNWRYGLIPAFNSILFCGSAFIHQVIKNSFMSFDYYC